MRLLKPAAFLVILLFTGGCITQFVPEVKEKNDFLVVEGLITDKKEVNTIKLSKSSPLGDVAQILPYTGCRVYLSDDLGNSYLLTERTAGNYVTDTSAFQGHVGRKYTLQVITSPFPGPGFSYSSPPVEMKPVPPIDTIYYEKVLLRESGPWHPSSEGAQLFLNTRDPSGKCRYFRWNYAETWEFRLPFSAPVNKTCWITEKSHAIDIKNTTVITDDVVDRHPVKFISNETDRLKVKYSILINQYSMNEDEYLYWEKLKNITQDVGGLYDIVPASIPGNITCNENPAEKVLGYFSVSARSSKRIFIKDYFSGIVNLYRDCIDDTVPSVASILHLNEFVWILELTPVVVVTRNKGCADCSVRGSLIRPEFWDEDLH